MQVGPDVIIFMLITLWKKHTHDVNEL